MKVLNNTFAILDLFLNNGSDLSLNELTKLSRLNKTTLSRIVKSLVNYGFLIQRERKGENIRSVINSSILPAILKT